MPRNQINFFGLGRGSGGPVIPVVAEWVGRVTPVDNQWIAITYARNTFVAIAQTGLGNRVMTSPDGVNWTIRATPAGANNVEWWGLAYSPLVDRFVAVARGGTGQKVMTSDDGGVTWVLRNAADNTKLYRDVTYVPWLAVFVAVGHAGAAMISADGGLGWAPVTLPTSNDYIGVCQSEAEHTIVAVANFGPGNRIAISGNGINFIGRPAPAANAWRSVVYAEGRFVCVAADSFSPEEPTKQVMTSDDGGTTWVLRDTPSLQAWERITYGNGLFAVVSSSPTGDSRAMTSRDGITWTLETTPHNQWCGVAYSPDVALFASVAFSGAGNRVMTRDAFNPYSNSIHVLSSRGFDQDPQMLAHEADPLTLEVYRT